MKIFHLPDLGEGLPDAEIHEWHVHEGEEVEVDQLLVSMETAKAVVEVPSPRKGKIAKLHGKAGDILLTGAPLVEYVDDTTAAEPEQKPKSLTVAGDIEIGDEVLVEAAMGITPTVATSTTHKVLPAVRALATKLGLDLNQIKGTGPNGQITADDVKHAKEDSSATKTPVAESGDTVTQLHGVRRTMAVAMAQSHAEVVPVVLVDDADIAAWVSNSDITTRLLRAIAFAYSVEPALNAHYDGTSMTKTVKSVVNVGLAMDTPEGLFVPVLKNIATLSQAQLREKINAYKQQVKDRSIASENLRDATISLSNFGVFAGRYANPIVVPPTVAIIGTGKTRDAVVAVNGKIEIHRILPLSLSFDHRAATGGEASRFLGAMIEDLQKAE